MCRVCVCVFFCMCFCLSHFVGLCFWCIVRFSSFDCVYFLFVFILCLYVLFCFQFSLPITKYFVCFAYNWMFLLALNKSAFFLLCFVSDSCLRLPCGWCLFLWPSADTLLRSLLVVSFCCVCVWVLFTHSLSFKYLDQRVGFFHCFLMISFCCFA